MLNSGSLSLRARLVGTMAVVFLGGMVVLYLAARSYALTAADRSYDRLLSGSALSIAETLSFDQGRVQVDLPYAALDMLSAPPEDRVFYRVYGPGEQTVTGYEDLPVLPLMPRGRTMAPGATTRFFDAVYRGEMVRFAVLGRQIAEPGINGWIWIQVGQTRRARNSLARELVLGALVPITLATFIALGLVWFGVARALRPLEIVGKELAERESFNLTPVEAAVPDEVRPMVDAMNGFMRRLGTNMETLRGFIAEAAHQMRTPLAALRAQAQLALEEDDPVQMRRSLKAVERNAARLTRLLNQMLSDATVTHRSEMRRFESFDLGRMVERAAAEAVPMRGDARVRFQKKHEEMPMNGDQVMLGEVVKNLIDNAIQHGRPVHEVEEVLIDMSLQEIGGAYLLEVSDRGPGISPEKRDQVFERFVRGEGAAPGAGLGMAIVKRVVESHLGTVELLDREGGGTTVRIVLPRRLQ